MKRGMFFSLDGIDGCGKSTQCRRLTDWLGLHGYSVSTCADPGGTALGQEIRSLLLDHRRHMNTACEALLFMASRAQLVAEVIRPALEAGSMVVCDRFVLANVAYQGHAGGLDCEVLWNIGKLATENLEPDLTIVLDLPVEAAARRRQGPADRMEQRSADYHEKVRAGFLHEVHRRPDRMAVVNAMMSADDVHQEICRLVQTYIQREQSHHELATHPRT